MAADGEMSSMTYLMSHPSFFTRTTSGRPKCGPSVSGSSLTSLKSNDDYHHARLGEYAASLWKQNAMTDVVVVVDQQEFRCHRAVLACYSPYFKEVLLKPGSGDVHNLEIPSITKRAFSILISYMYTGEMNMTCQDLSDVYRAARRLSMKEALNKCREMLAISPDRIENSIHLFVTSKKLDMAEPCKRAFNVMLSHFDVLVRTKEFLNLDLEQVTDYLKADIIGTTSEVNVFLAALEWINFNFIEREKDIDRVMNCIRFPLMNLAEVLACHHPPLLPAIVLYPSVRERLFNATCYVAAKQMGQESLFQELSCEPRQYLLQEQPSLLWDYENLYNPELYPEYRARRAATKIQATFRGYRTRKQINIAIKEKSDAAVQIQSAFRGYYTRKILKNKKKFMVQFQTGEWKRPYSREKYSLSGHRSEQDFNIRFPSEHYSDTQRKSSLTYQPPRDFSMPAKQNLSTISELSKECQGNSIYAIGNAEAGGDCNKNNALLCFSPTSNVWKKITTLPEPRGDIRVVMLDNILYCIGGSNARVTSKRIVATKNCYKFNVDMHKWEDMSPLRHPRILHAAAILNGSIYTVGGKDDKGRILSSVEHYDVHSNRWMEAAPISSSRMAMGIATYDGMIWVTGGMTASLNEKIILVDIVECYNEKTGRWKRQVKLPQPMGLMALIPCRERLYSIGGAVHNSKDKHDIVSISNAYVFNTKNECWTEIQYLPSPWDSVIASSIDDDIYVFGGHYSQKFAWLKEVFFYNSIMRRWRPCCLLPAESGGRIIAAVGSM